MVSSTTREKIIHDLEKFFGIKDVYWHRDRLFVINSYDVPDVQEYLGTSDLNEYVTYQYVDSDEPVYNYD